MEYRRLGSSGLSVSEIAFGNWLTHDTTADPAGTARAAYDAGITTFQTAACWGTGAAETTLERGLRGVRRESLVLCSGAFWPQGTGPNDRGLGRKHLTESVHGSLRRLRTDYLDLFALLHFDVHTPLEETFGALADLVHQGKILYVATAGWDGEQITRAAALAAELRVPLVANQPHYSMLWRVPEHQIIPVCQRLGIGQLVSLPLAQGILTGKYRRDHVPPGSRAADPRVASVITPLLDADLLDRLAMLDGIAADCGLATAQLALAWTLQNTGVAAAVTGAASPEQITGNAKAAGTVLDWDVLVRVTEILGGFIQSDPRLNFVPTLP